MIFASWFRFVVHASVWDLVDLGVAALVIIFCLAVVWRSR